MNKRALAKLRRRLIDTRNRLRDDISHLEQQALTETRVDASGTHIADAGSESFDQDFSLGLLESDAGVLRLIDDALAAMDLGTYGICLDCQKPIAIGRLEAMPFVKRCVACKERFEREARR